LTGRDKAKGKTTCSKKESLQAEAQTPREEERKRKFFSAHAKKSNSPGPWGRRTASNSCTVANTSPHKSQNRIKKNAREIPIKRGDNKTQLGRAQIPKNRITVSVSVNIKGRNSLV